MYIYTSESEEYKMGGNEFGNSLWKDNRSTLLFRRYFEDGDKMIPKVALNWKIQMLREKKSRGKPRAMSISL